MNATEYVAEVQVGGRMIFRDQMSSAEVLEGEVMGSVDAE